MDNQPTVTIDVRSLSDDQVMMLLRSSEAGCADIRTPERRSEPARDYSIASAGQANCARSGAILATEAWRRGLMSAPQQEATDGRG